MSAIVRSPLPDVPIPSPQSFFQHYLPSKPRYSDYPAFIDGSTGRTISGAQLREDSLRLGKGLQKELQLSGHEETVAVIYSSNSVDFAQIFYGCQSVRIITSLANASYTAAELAHQLRDGDPAIAFVHPSNYEGYAGAIQMLNTEGRKEPQLFWAVPLTDVPKTLRERTGVKSYQSLMVNTSDLDDFEGLSAEGEAAHQTALLCYSSGTTGLAKGVMSTHHNLNVNGQISALSWYPTNMVHGQPSVILGACPWYHIYGLMEAAVIPLLKGVPVVILPRFTPEGFFQAIHTHKITHAFVAPPMILHLANNSLADKYDLKKLKWMRCAAAPLGRGLIKKVKSRLGDDVHITQGYGLTEVTCLCTAQTIEDAISNPGSVGRLYPCLEAKIVDEDFQPAKIGEPGELCIRGATVMKGYWRNDEATKASFTPDGWYRSGDIAHIDPKGHVYIVDRLKELIKYKGFQVPPADLEKLLLTNPKVGDAAVIGVHSREHATELPRAYVVPVGGLGALSEAGKAELATELVNWVEKNVANHKRLRGGCILVDAIPKSRLEKTEMLKHKFTSAAGKILRKQLRAMAKEQEAVQRQQTMAKL
ncbi:hypothetical protein QFC20_001015 [Naganishia adeliensis]|uniref:Uncharacterized protein n=1 Tax=Naganishia adeliensis TaxID=92952 RepID=A0ACC2WV95_9TREE|nr:hypothetical protein QFC20_001015 [Naganishia adeliensis]